MQTGQLEKLEKKTKATDKQNINHVCLSVCLFVSVFQCPSHQGNTHLTAIKLLAENLEQANEFYRTNHIYLIVFFSSLFFLSGFYYLMFFFPSKLTQ